MAKAKEFNLRMEGMRYALEIANKEGIEGLRKECARRNVSMFSYTISKAESEKIWTELSNNMYVNVVMTFLSVLHNSFGWEAEAIKTIKAEYDKAVKCALDLDYMGEHYVRLEDYAVELNELGLDLDVNRIASCQDHFDECSGDSQYHRVDVKRVLEELRENGFENAAEFLEQKLE